MKWLALVLLVGCVPQREPQCRRWTFYVDSLTLLVDSTKVEEIACTEREPPPPPPKTERIV